MSNTSVLRPDTVQSPKAYASSSITRPAGATPYSINDVIQNGSGTNMVFSISNIAPGSHIMITSILMRIDAGSSTCPALTLHLFKDNPTPIADNAPFDIIAADKSKFLTSVSLAAPVLFGSRYYSINPEVNRHIYLSELSTSIYCVLVTPTAWTPGSEVVKTFDLLGICL